MDRMANCIKIVFASVIAIAVNASLTRADDAISVQAFIYYDVRDKAFERAAKTKAAEIRGEALQEFLKVRTKEDFIDAWETIKSQAETNRAVVTAVHLYTHATLQTNQRDGLEFAGEKKSGRGGTLTKQEIEQLPRLPWAKESSIVLYGCHTGVTAKRGWCPAETFAKTQGVPASGLIGFGYFSTDPNKYVKKSPGDMRIYLYAYQRGQNKLLGDGKKLPEKLFKP